MHATSVTLAERPAGYAVMVECLAQQQRARERGAVARALGVGPLHPDAASWFSGAVGERRVAAQLARLGPEWTVLHAVPVGDGSSDIDHVVIGPAGLFTINTKRHAGQKIWLGSRMLRVGGRDTDYLKNARCEAKRTISLLVDALGDLVPVRPVIVLVDAGPMTVKQRPIDVTVLELPQLVRWLNSRRRLLTDDDVAQVVAAASDTHTWHPTASDAIDPDAPRAFEALAGEVRAARNRRVIAAVTGTAAALAAGGSALQVLF